MKVNPALLIGGGVAAYFLLKGNNSPIALPGQTQHQLNSAPPGQIDTAGQPTTLYPYLLPNSPTIPANYDQTYYMTYIHPAMVAADSNVNNPAYTLTPAQANTYLANYTDVQQWANSSGVLAENQTGHSVLGAVQYHWHTYGPHENRTYLELPWNYPAAWIPPPVHPKSSGIFGDILKVATFVGGGIAEIATAGALTSVIVPATTSALALESSIHGLEPKLSDEELQILFTGSAILIDILPYYNQANKKMVKMINNKLYSLLNQYS